ncbi:late secretory pathway protein AVL9 homolog [Neocloeon triangulifer]|uniref:late secretory pathway protein AVL9 homolog n=1 Tax=Neocloeon triangulifer TaxID=2078957 RepID=UPI00286F8FEA|nr:late secretory pathway protein AVL9 homolog [Neocloeon triangulifer]
MDEENPQESATAEAGPILHVIVIGFHHKKGCQVEYSYPPLVPGGAFDSNECPPGWHYLPTLALPDGSHNYEDDTVYFHLPSLTNSRETIFGVSCFRQIPVEKLKNRTPDITRGTVQKSVCVLSKLPLFGHIQVKMALITHAYFDEGDFSKVSLLEDTYKNLNGCLSLDLLDSSQAFEGLSLREFILQFKHKAVLLFKLLLLEKRVIFFKSPVQQLCATILSVLSLHPGMIEKGLKEAAYVKTSRPMSPLPNYPNDSPATPPESPEKSYAKLSAVGKSRIPHSSSMNSLGGRPGSSFAEEPNPSLQDISSATSDEFECARSKFSNSVAQIDSQSCGLPLSIFTKGYLCHPYLSLPYMDMLTDVNVRGYIIGATNVLFKQKNQLADVLVEVEDTRIETSDPDLRRQLHLTTEDLRFADYVVKHVTEDILDGAAWEGGDEWIRAQFKVYLLSLLRTSMLNEGSRELDFFNAIFISAWKDSYNYKYWISKDYGAIMDVPPGHPFAGQLSMADMKLRLSHTMQNTEGGRKLSQAMVNTGRAVTHTGKAVGGAISQAKGAFSSWWSNITSQPNNGQSEKIEELPEDGLDIEPDFIVSPEAVENQESKDESWVTLDQMRQKARKNKNGTEKSKAQKEPVKSKEAPLGHSEEKHEAAQNNEIR